MTDSVVAAGATEFYYDMSQPSPASWQWSINGALPNNSLIQNPISTFNLPGTYPVQLIVPNANGTDTVVNSLFVVNEFTICNPVSNSTNLMNGILYDSGGPISTISANENCEFIIAHGVCTDSIVLSIQYFHNGD